MSGHAPGYGERVRSLAVWAVLFAAYAATLGVDAAGSDSSAGAEPRYLLTVYGVGYKFADQ